ncbi:MAG: lipid asymmetry maintenance ABC transporter permease subunit MlaE [Pseudomonadota bacterium]
MTTLVRELAYSLRSAVEAFGAAQLFFLRVLAQTPRALLRPRLIIEQIHASGSQSLIIIMICGLFVGMVMALQGYDSLSRFGAEESLGGVAALALFRELGPVVTALLFSGRAGTSLASEIGLMRATEQLSAMEMMAVDPVQRVVVPRFLGGVISMPLLAAVFSAIGIFGAYLVGVGLAGVDQGAFWAQMQQSVDLFDDLLSGVIKSVVFGIAATFIAVFEGYNAMPTAEGVSRATTRTVVIGAIAVLILDFMLTAVMLEGV